jgi:transcription initiation factor TFIID TATA-box-binding protein|tara:strand:- start:449 stop:1132 length:684 start_codon:yes stop_codon:yes gene_type:complete
MVKKTKKRVKLDLTAIPEHTWIPAVNIENIVSTFSIGLKKLDLKKLASQYLFIDYNPHKFAAATIRLSDPRTTALLFSSGNVVCTGGKNTNISRLAARKYVRLLQTKGIRVCMKNFKIQNIVATSFINAPLKLREFANDFGAYTSYEPELFPGLVFRTIEPRVVFLVFRSGKVVITGAKKKETILTVFRCFYNSILTKYIDNDSSTRCSAEYRIKYKRSLLDPANFV